MLEQAEEKTFYVELIKPSRYDDDGYVIQWMKSIDISNSLTCLYGLSIDAGRQNALGDHVKIIVDTHDEFNSVVPVKKIIRKFKKNDLRGLVCMVGVQTNQYPRALDIAKGFRESGIQVVIGGFHVSGSMALTPGIPESLQEALDNGITLFAGEAEGRIAGLFIDAYNQQLKPVYNYLGNLPDLSGQPIPIQPSKYQKERLLKKYITIDTSRGCPFKCSFCTIINVQGNKSRARSADDLEKMIRLHSDNSKKVDHLFITDDNFARNKNREEILDRLIYLREEENIRIKFGIQVDMQAYKIPGFSDKVARAGCTYVFIGMESINTDALANTNKGQNHVSQYREMIETWHKNKIVIIASYILGFPGETRESIRRDIETIKRELPVDLMWFFCLTMLPGSADYNKHLNAGKWLEADLNKYDTCHTTFKHSSMSDNEWLDIYKEAWNLYYTPEHVEQILKNALANGMSTSRLTSRIMYSYCGMKYNDLHPLYFGLIRRKIRKQRRKGMPLENPLIFYPREFFKSLRNILLSVLYLFKLERTVKRLKK